LVTGMLAGATKGSSSTQPRCRRASQ
jgi:hypothetical protein